MTPRERVLTTFSHSEPDRVPQWFGMSEEFLTVAMTTLGTDALGVRRRLGDDFHRIHAEYQPDKVQLSPGATTRTIFGVERAGIGYGQPLAHPLANATLEELHAYPWPNAAIVDVSRLSSAAAPWRHEYAILGGDWSPFWHDAIDLVGMERLFEMMHDDPPWVDALLGHLVDFYVAANQRIFAEAGSEIDIFFIGNDFGSQTGPLLSPKSFNRFILPQLRRLINLGHDYRLKVQLHCCGGFRPLIPALIAAELDALHAIQCSCIGMDLASLKADFGTRLVLNGGIDSHHVLIDGDPSSIREDTRKVMEIMMPGGGFVAGASHDWILPETPVANVVAMADAVREFGVYADALV
ncbi:MAG: uroporphyrinogen decarboxylase family protein [Planctomycetota bacterium]